MDGYAALGSERGRTTRICRQNTNGTFVNDQLLGKGNCTLLLENDRVRLVPQVAAGAFSDTAEVPGIVQLGPASQSLWAECAVQVSEEIMDRYDFKCEIGAGNFATVWLVIHKRSGDKYACKLINRKKQLFQTGLSSVFEREISILKQLKHPQIINLHELYSDADYIYIFMEYIQGGDLMAALAQRGPLSEAEARELFLQIADGIRYLHWNGISHRDIKLENILVVSDTCRGRGMLAKLADFAGELMKTVCGTPSYLAPEITCQHGASAFYNHAVDIWAMGILLYVMPDSIFNRFPFSALLAQGKADHQAYKHACEALRQSPDFGRLSETLQDLISSMLAVDPAQRLNIDSVILHPWGYRLERAWGMLVSAEGTDIDATIMLFRNTTSIGRSQDCHIRIANPRISGYHCLLVRQSSEIYLHDTSRSGCMVNGVEVGYGRHVAVSNHGLINLLADRSDPRHCRRAARPIAFRLKVLDPPYQRVWVSAALPALDEN
ncbi:hypothetical protein EV182_000385 [Spiromyces aspiralis]|uniref:Uncharacterized protein n=1 Tax=Spiromyces aspiralis TaxID=68401 RepID=A0ACC1HW26_9FUNG|nr:hypothetical protein EV182_000385 [Spiromyces aspiralis]